MTTVLRFTPTDKISINLASNESARTSITVENTSSTPVAFKVKTTQPKRYLVKPNQGVLEPGASDRIQIQIVPKDRAQLLTKPSQAASDRFLVQGVACEDKLIRMDKESEEFIKELTSLWSGLDKNAPQQSAKFSVGFITPFDAAKGLEAGPSGGGEGASASSALGKERLKELLAGPGGGGGGEAGNVAALGGNNSQELYTMRKKYDDLVSYTVSLTAERDRLKNDLDQTKKDYNKAVVARLSAEKGGDASKAGSKTLTTRKGTEDGFSLIQVILVAVLCFFLGRFVHA